MAVEPPQVSVSNLNEDFHAKHTCAGQEAETCILTLTTSQKTLIMGLSSFPHSVLLLLIRSHAN